MAIKQLRITDLRLIDLVEFEPTDKINLIWGANGSGKTTILEAIYLLGRGKSFRKSEREQLIQIGKEQFSLFIRSRANQKEHTLGLQKSLSGMRAKMDGKAITRMSELARAIPLAVITPNSHEILERGPQYRRRFLDWGVFHVEPEFRNIFERFARCLRQRNAALRVRGKFDISWDKEFIEAGTAVNMFREKYYNLFSVYVRELAVELLGIDNIQTEWKKGWSDRHDLYQTLEEMKAGDIQAGYTRYGPHRADLSVKLRQQKVERIASRGQQKMLVVAMYLAQVKIARELLGTNTIILIDDLTSELDLSNRKKLLTYLQQMGNQVFITGVDDITGSGHDFTGVFHVEQGAIYGS